NKNYNNIYNKIKNMNVMYKEDVFHEVLLMFMENPRNVELINDGVADKYIIGMFKINSFSKTSPYYYLYNRIEYIKLNENISKQEPVDNDYSGICLALLYEKIDDLDVEWIDKLLFREYVDNKINGKFSMSKLSELTDISQSSIGLKIRNLKKIIK
ncbi:MAG: hypothetical protein KC589_09110, partial [Nanoarchaeota archaeon]|nr:hypothetical protein [Nanoarchaeota archaeon]